MMSEVAAAWVRRRGALLAPHLRRVRACWSTTASRAEPARAVGEVSLATHPVWDRLLAQAAGRDDEVYCLELSAVTFIDVAGVTALVVTAQSLAEGRRIVLCRPPAALRRVLALFWSELPGIEVAAS